MFVGIPGPEAWVLRFGFLLEFVFLQPRGQIEELMRVVEKCPGDAWGAVLVQGGPPSQERGCLQPGVP